ncbi:MAG: HIT family protein [Chitinophagaceae bacterium]
MTIFSKIIARQIPCYLIAENNNFIAFLDVFPLQKGHVLVVPKIEIDKVFDLPVNYLAEMLVFAQPIAKAIEKSFDCNRVSMLTVGLEVPHAHLHLIPINGIVDIDFSQKKLQLSKDEFMAIQNMIINNL